MAKILTAALACSLLLGACSSIKPVEDLEAGNSTGSSNSTEPGDSAESGDTPEALSLEEAPDFTQDISLADVLAAIDDLRVPQPVAVTLTMTYPVDLGELLTPGDTISTTETVTSSPLSTITHLSVDRTEYGAAIESQLADAAAAEAASDAEETWLPAWGAVSAGDSIAMEYLIEQGPERAESWIKMSDLTAHEKAQNRAIGLLYEANDIDLPVLDLPQFRQKWISERYDDRAPFPSGYGLYLTPSFANEMLRSVGFSDGEPPTELSLSEVSRESQQIVMELSHDLDDGNIRIEFDATGRIVAMEERAHSRTTRLEFNWDPDLDLLSLPPIELRMSEDDLIELQAAFFELHDDGSGREIVIID